MRVDCKVCGYNYEPERHSCPRCACDHPVINNMRLPIKEEFISLMRDAGDYFDYIIQRSSRYGE